jgi:hypothetical protein
MNVYHVKINEETFQVEAKEIFTASLRAIDIYHEKRKALGKRNLSPKHVEMLIVPRHALTLPSQD